MKPLFIFFLFSYSLLIHSQIQTLKPTFINSETIEADDFVGYDGFENIFYIKNNVLFKKTEKSLLNYQNLALGKIKKVDILNPLKVVVFYEEFNTVVLLDKQMNEIQKIDFSKNETPIIASAIGMSGQNQLWLYNSLNQQIGLYEIATNKFKNLGIPIKENILFYQTDFNNFDWIDKQNQWFSCSIFGRVINNGKLKYQNQIQLFDKNLVIYLKENELFLFDRSSALDYKIVIIDKSFEKFYYKDQILSIFTNQGITNYKITLP